MSLSLTDALQRCPLVAILRGLKPEAAIDVGQVLVKAGFRIIEVPLLAPDALTSIRHLAEQFKNEVLIGAGAVMRAGDVEAIIQAGARLVMMPNTDVEVIRAAKAHGLYCAPGAATPTEAFTALSAGADALELFPAEGIPPRILQAWRGVMPGARLLPVGGIDSSNMAVYRAAGSDGFGVGSTVYKPNRNLGDIRDSAQRMVKAARLAFG